MRLFNAGCFGFFVLALLSLIDAGAEAFADALADDRPTWLMRGVLCFAPLGPALLGFPILGGVAHWRCHRPSASLAWQALTHLLLALAGGLAVSGCAMIRLYLTYLNGARPVTAGQVIANVLLLALFIAAVRAGKMARREGTAG